jgi:DNA polymerase V
MIGLVDCNNFYASCERLFQPKLAGRPIVVLSNNDGCVIARSDEAKLLGIEMGAPAFLMEEMLSSHQVAVFSSNYTLYGSLSDRVMQTLHMHCHTVEVYSIDEAFLYLYDMPHISYEQYAINLRAAVKATGIPVSIGIAPTKTLAKLANRYAKEKKKAIGVHVLDNQDKIDEVLSSSAIDDVWGVGPQYTKLLQRHGFKTAMDLVRAPEEWIRKSMTVVGQRLLNELKGIPCIEMETEEAPRKNICVARSFGQLLSEKKEIAEALANYTAIAARKLRKQHSCARVINVFLQTNNFRQQDEQYFRSINLQLPVPSSNTTELLQYATKALDLVYRSGYNFKKVGVMLLELIPSNQVQSGIFDQRDRPRDQRLMTAVDAINRSWNGKELVKFGRQSGGRRWTLRQERLSPCYTTRLQDVLTINI